ncbi:MAG: hypothetical protein IJ833_04095 [Lachnospiraceae bacterium]|nr:hypothetical protein [Lachnospiraceae bacterium]
MNVFKSVKEAVTVRQVAESYGINEPVQEEFRPLTEAEQLSLPFDKPDREKSIK